MDRHSYQKFITDLSSVHNALRTVGAMTERSRTRFRSRGALPVAVHATIAAALLAGATADGVPLPDQAAGQAAGPGTIEGKSSVQQVGEAAAPAPETPAASGSRQTETPGSTAPQAVDADSRLAQALAPVLQASDGRISVAVQDLDRGTGAAYGQERFDTASIVKLDILAALLLSAQDAGRELTTEEERRAAVMIRQSDNDAADALWQTIGGRTGLDRANERLGLRDTRAGERGRWGLTQTTAQDQLTLLRAVYGEFGGQGGTGPLDARSRTYLQTLLGEVIPEQSWGVSAAADGEQFELKNGWLPRSTTGRWDVNSIGRLTSDGRDYLVVVLSDGHATFADGVDRVEQAARAAVAIHREFSPAAGKD